MRSKSGDKSWDILPRITSSFTVPTPKTTTSNNTENLNIILRTDKKAADLAAYHHGAAFSPTHDTFVKAIEKKYFFGWPGLNSSLIKNTYRLLLQLHLVIFVKNNIVYNQQKLNQQQQQQQTSLKWKIFFDLQQSLYKNQRCLLRNVSYH